MIDSLSSILYELSKAIDTWNKWVPNHMSSVKTVSTSHGDVKLLHPPEELMETIHSLLPLGLVRYIPTLKAGADHGIVVKRGEKELFCIKRQLVDYDEEQSKTTSYVEEPLLKIYCKKQ